MFLIRSNYSLFLKISKCNNNFALAFFTTKRQKTVLSERVVLTNLLMLFSTNLLIVYFKFFSSLLTLLNKKGSVMGYCVGCFGSRSLCKCV